MTRIPEILGPSYDAPTRLAASLYIDQLKRETVSAELRRAVEASAEEPARLMRWELAMLDLLPVVQDGTSPWQGASYEQYAASYCLSADTVAYARDRARETQDLRLKVRYLEFALRRADPPTGRPWIELHRELLGAYREYVNACDIGSPSDPNGHTGVYIYDAVNRIGQLLSVRGVLAPSDAPVWAEWILGLAEHSLSFTGGVPGVGAQRDHRWVADYLQTLSSLPPEAASEGLRIRALELLAEAARHYETVPILYYIEQATVQIEADLRKYWGETDTHRWMIRRQFAAVLRCAQLHRTNGNDLVAGWFFRSARDLAEKQRQYFTDAEIAELGRAEQAAIVAGQDELTRIHISIPIPGGLMDYVGDTPEATVQAIVAEAAKAVPDRARIRKDVLEGNQQAPLQAIIGRTIIGPGKVVGKTAGEEGNVEADIDFRAVLQTHAVASGIAAAIQKAAAQVSLTPEHLVAQLAPLDLDDGTIELIRHGLARLIVGDSISATHILVPRVEDALRQHLNRVGFDTTDYRTQADRTDDTTLGTLMWKKLPDGRSVRDYLGGDLWEHMESLLNRKTGPNLRNDFAHGLARPAQCSPTVAGIAFLLLYQLAGVASRGWTDRPSELEPG